MSSGGRLAAALMATVAAGAVLLVTFAPWLHRDAQSFAAVLDAELEATGFSGTALVAEGDHVLLERGYGLADRDTRTPNDRDTVFKIASITKSFTAVAVLQLVERGLIDLGAPISTYLPRLPDGQMITTHQLLSHTAGLGRDLSSHNAVAPDAPTGDALALGSAPARIAVPGGGWAYSNYGYLLLELLVEEVSDQTFGEYLHDNVFAPAGMATASVAPAFGPVAEVPAVARGYVDVEGQLVGYVPFPDVWWGGLGSGGISATAHDLLRFHAGLVDGTLVSRASQERMYREVAEGYAYGWWTSADGTMLWHDGDLESEGFHSWFVRDLGHDVVVVLLANTSTWTERGDFLVDVHATSPGAHAGPPIWLVAFPIAATAAAAGAWLAILVERLRLGTHLLRRPRWRRLASHLLALVIAAVALSAILRPLALARWRLLWMISPSYAALFPSGLVLLAVALIATLAAFVVPGDARAMRRSAGRVGALYERGTEPT